MLYREDKQYYKNGRAFSIERGFTKWHALYLIVPLLLLALIPYMYLSAQSTQTISSVDNEDVLIVASNETIDAVDNAETPLPDGKNKILFVGDSITRGMMNCDYTTKECDKTSESAVSKEIELLGEEEFTAKVDNSSVQTTADYIAKASTVDEGTKIAQIMLGTNDAGEGVSKVQYKKNMQTIVDGLLKTGVEKVIINKPIYATNISDEINTFWSYLQKTPSIFDNKKVVKGDESAYDWFKKRTHLLDGDGQGFHPDEYGYEVLGKFWAEALQEVIDEDV